MSAPLAGIRVLDLSNLLPGPYATWLLQQLGAEVVKLERPPEGDMARELLPEVFRVINAEKKSIAINLKTAEGRSVFHRLVPHFDVVVEGFRPGVVHKLGVDYDTLKSIKPDLIYCSMSGYGQSYQTTQSSHDINYLGESGILSVTGRPNDPPAWPGGIQVADLSASLFAVVNILASVVARQNSGRGAYLDVSMLDACLAVAIPRMAEYLGTGKPEKSTFLARGAYGVFHAGDGRDFTLGCIEDVFWKNLCRLLERELGKDTGLDLPIYATYKDRNQHAEELNQTLARYFTSRSRDEWLQLFQEYDIPAGPVNSFADVLANPALNSRSVFQSLVPESSMQIYGIFGNLGSHTPSLGQHTREIVSLVAEVDEIDRLLETGAVWQPTS